MFGQLQPLPDGDPTQLANQRLRVGRKPDNDVVLPFSNVSSHHGLMQVNEGYWYIKDLNSKNGIKINGKRISPGVFRRVNPGERISFGKQEYILEYEPVELGAQGLPPSQM